jgi:hypothetical protein
LPGRIHPQVALWNGPDHGTANFPDCPLESRAIAS